MEYDQIYELVFQELRRIREKLLKDPNYKDQGLRNDLMSGNIARNIALVLYDSGQLKLQKNIGTTDRNEISQQLPDNDKSRVIEVLWRLVSQGILCPRTIGDETNHHFFNITELGEQIIDSGTDSPYDPFGYMKRLKDQAPNLDRNTVTYVEEALQCFLAGHFTGASVVLGVASENEILDLIEKYVLSIPEPDQSKLRTAIEKQNPIKKRFEKFFEHLNQGKAKLPLELRGEMDTFLNGIFNIVRLYRNDTGHPTGQRANRETIYANLNLFLFYARRISELKNELNPQ